MCSRISFIYDFSIVGVCKSEGTRVRQRNGGGFSIVAGTPGTFFCPGIFQMDRGWWLVDLDFLFPGISICWQKEESNGRDRVLIGIYWFVIAVIYSVWAACLSTVWGILRFFDAATWCWCQWILIKIDFGRTRQSIWWRRGFWLIWIYSLVYSPISLEQTLFDSP